MAHLTVAILAFASLAIAQDNSWCGYGANRCDFTGRQLSNLACGWCRSWTFASSVAGDTLRMIGLDGGALPGDGNPSNRYMAQVSLASSFNLSDGSAWSLTTLPSNVPNVRGGAFWSDRNNSTIYALGGRAPDETTVPGNNALPQLAIADSTWSDPVSDVTVGRSFAGVYVNVPDRQIAYSIGGYQDKTTSTDFKNDSSLHFTSQIIAFNTTSATPNEIKPPFLPVQYGGASYLPYGKSGSLIFFGGESPSSYTVSDCTDCQVNSWDHVWVYDIGNQQWYRQNTTGYIQPRSEFCTSTVFDQATKSWQIWTMGGVNFKSSAVLSSVAVLSIPSFQWFNATSSGIQRMSVSCETVGSQVFVLGGRNADTAVGGTNYANVAYIYDVNKQAVATTYDPSFTKYAAPSSISAAVSTLSTPAVWTDAALQSLFTNNTASAATPSAITTVNPSTSQAASSSSSSTLNGGDIAGIVIGILALLLAICAVALVLRRRMRRSSAQHDNAGATGTYEKAELADTMPRDDAKHAPSEVPAAEVRHQLPGSHARWEMDAASSKHHQLPGGHEYWEMDAVSGKSAAPNVHELC